MTAALIWAVAVGVAVWAAGELLAVWHDRPRPMRDSDGHWKAPNPPRNGWGPRR